MDSLNEFYPFLVYGVILCGASFVFANARKFGHRQPLIISLEGNIGSGKSTLLAEMKEKFKHNTNIAFLPEPVDTWNTITDAKGVTILEKYYKNQTKYAFPFQMMAYISRLALLREALKCNYDIIITERSIYTDRNVFAKMLHDDEKIEDVNYAIYLRWFEEFIEDLPPIKFVYINTYPGIALERVEMRARPGETIPLQYLQNCHAYHNRWINNTDSANVLTLDGNVDVTKCPEILDDWLLEIERFMY